MINSPGKSICTLIMRNVKAALLCIILLADLYFLEYPELILYNALL